ncbi:MAG: hypothetical protein AAFN74_21210 [Myxococcota bacterium]
MTDPKAQVDMARVALRRAIAGAMVRKEHAEEQLAVLVPELEGRRADRALAASAADAALQADLERVVTDLERQVDVHEQAKTLAESDIDSLKRELVAMDGLERDAERAAGLTAVRDAEDADATEQATLARVRSAINSLEAEADLNDELTQETGLRRRIEKATADAAAKARLAELKAAHVDRLTQEATTSDIESDGDDDAPPKRKRTL